MSGMPSLFTSHGAPTLAIEPGPAHDFLKGLGKRCPRPAAIVVASAHWLTAAPMVDAAATPETIHDFGDFPRGMTVPEIDWEVPLASDYCRDNQSPTPPSSGMSS